jgi:hypothetical protein
MLQDCVDRESDEEEQSGQDKERALTLGVMYFLLKNAASSV